jgi:hypothetical protein
MVGQAATLPIRVLGGKTKDLAPLRLTDMKTEMSVTSASWRVVFAIWQTIGYFNDTQNIRQQKNG